MFSGEQVLNVATVGTHVYQLCSEISGNKRHVHIERVGDPQWSEYSLSLRSEFIFSPAVQQLKCDLTKNYDLSPILHEYGIQSCPKEGK